MDYHLFENTKQIAADSQGAIKNRLELEKERLLSGKRPEHLFQNPQQNKALKLLATFFAVMLILTVISRTATAMAIARSIGGNFKSRNLNTTIHIIRKHCVSKYR